MTVWHIQSRNIDKKVQADDQFAAWDMLREEPVEHFGLIVTAEQSPKTSGTVAVHSAMLMFRWQRDDDAYLILHAAMLAGLPDTKEADMKAAGRTE